MACTVPATEANELYECLKGDFDIGVGTDLDGLFESPYDKNHSIYTDTTEINLSDLTNKTPTEAGTGVLDVLMNSVKLHLQEEYDKNRLSGAEYATVYVALTDSVINNSVQFLLNKDKVKWDAINAQVTAIKANTDLAKARIEYETTMVAKAVAEAQLATGKINLKATEVNIQKLEYEVDNLLNKQNELLKAQVAKEYAATEDKPVKWSATGELVDAVGEVGGVIGKQKAIYEQQEKSFKQDTINNTVNQLHSTWAATITNGLDAVAPSKIGQANFEKVINDQFAALKENTGYNNS